MRLLLNTLQVIAGLVLAVLILALLATVLPTLAGDESFVVLSGSMEPNIHVGEIAVVQPTSVENLRLGDVITYRTPQQPDVIVTHRLVNISQDADGKLQFQTKGDANNVSDLVPVDSNAVLGKVAFHIPLMGYVVEFSQTLQGRLLLLIVPAILLGLDYARSRFLKRTPVAVPLAVASASSAVDAQRVAALLDRGRQAMATGHPELAGRAADGVLEMDAHNEDAWLLKAEATADPAVRLSLLQAALAVNPRAARLAAAADALQQPSQHPSLA